MTKEVQDIVFAALHKGRLMRASQKEYFKTRTQKSLQESRRLEVEFDEGLDEAAYAVKHGEPKPKQGVLL